MKRAPYLAGKVQIGSLYRGQKRSAEYANFMDTTPVRSRRYRVPTVLGIAGLIYLAVALLRYFLTTT